MILTTTNLTHTQPTPRQRVLSAPFDTIFDSSRRAELAGRCIQVTTAASDPSPDAPMPDEAPTPVNGGLGAAWILEFDLPALLAELGLTSSSGEDDDQDALLEAEQEALAEHDGTTVDVTSRVAEFLPPGPGLACVLAQQIGRAHV